MKKSSGASALRTMGVVLLVIAVLAGVYVLRSPDEPSGAVAGSSSASGAALTDMPVQALSVKEYQKLAPGAQVPVVLPGEQDAPSTDASASPDDDVVGAPADRGYATSAGPGGAEDGNTTLFMDGWSVKLLGSPQVGLLDSSLGRAATVALKPLSADQIRDAASKYPRVIEGYLARLYTSSSSVTCADGVCTVDGNEVDPGDLADVTGVPGLGDVYAGSGITSGLYGARVATGNLTGTMRVLTPYSHADLTSADPIDDSTGKVIESKPSPTNGFKDAVWPLAFGLGRVFVNDPRWTGDNPSVYAAQGELLTLDTNLVAASIPDRLLLAPISDTRQAGGTTQLTDSQLTFITSPTTGCGTVVLCTTGKADVKVDDYANSYTVACYKEPSQTGYGKVLLYSQSGKVTVTLDEPAILSGAPGTTAADNVVGVNANESTPQDGTSSFFQQAVFLADDDGVLDLAGVRDREPFSFTDQRLFGGSFVSCEAAQ